LSNGITYSMNFTYNRQKAIEYAKKYAFIRNPNFYDFENLGGNCTNFVSQCLLAGGCPQNFHYPLGWFYKNLNNRSPSFTGVQYLYDFLTRTAKNIGAKANLELIQNLEAGDIIQLSFDEIKFSHTLIITQINEFDRNNPLCATNSFDAFDRPLLSYSYFGIRGLHIL